MEHITAENVVAFLLGVILSRLLIDMIFGPLWWR